MVQLILDQMHQLARRASTIKQLRSSKRKEKEEYLYSAILADTHSQSAETWITQFYTMSAFPS